MLRKDPLLYVGCGKAQICHRKSVGRGCRRSALRIVVLLLRQAAVTVHTYVCLEGSMLLAGSLAACHLGEVMHDAGLLASFAVNALGGALTKSHH